MSGVEMMLGRVRDELARASAAGGFEGRFADALLSRRLASVLLFAALGAWVAYRMALRSFLGVYVLTPWVTAPLHSLIAVALLLSEGGRFLRGEQSRRDAAALGVFLAASVGFAAMGMEEHLIDTLMVFALRNEGFRRMARFGAAVLAACLLAVLAACVLGIVPDHVAGLGGNGRIRHYLGFTYCLFGPQVLFTVTLSWCWLRDGRMRWMEIAGLAAANAVLFVLTVSRLSFGLSVLCLAVAALRKLSLPGGPLAGGRAARLWSALARTSAWGFPAMAVLSILLVATWAFQVAAGAGWLDGLNSFFGGRIRLTYDAFAQFGFMLFGQPVAWIGNGLGVNGAGFTGDPSLYNYVDNLFFQSLIERGLVYTAILVTLYTLAARRAVREGDAMLAIVLGILSLHCLVDDLALQLCFNTLLLACGSYVVSGAGGGDAAGDRPAS